MKTAYFEYLDCSAIINNDVGVALIDDLVRFGGELLKKTEPITEREWGEW